MEQKKGLRGTVHVVVSNQVKADDLHKALDAILKAGGCLACGLVGIDWQVHGPVDHEPDWNAQIREGLERVSSVVGTVVVAR